MATTPVCTHGMPSPASCTTCMDEIGLGPAPVEPVTVVGTFAAKFVGTCAAPSCRGEIWPGQRISRLSDDTYVHELCAAAAGVSS